MAVAVKRSSSYKQISIRLVRVLLLFAVLSLGFTSYEIRRLPHLELTLEVASSAPSVAQLFYDVGHGFNEQNSRSVKLSSSDLQSFQKLTFPLPRRRIFGLRFDPATIPGTVIVRQIAISSDGHTVVPIAASDVVPYNQIATRVESPEGLTFTTLPGANDPGISIRLHSPLTFTLGLSGKNYWPILIGNIILLFIAALVVWGAASAPWNRFQFAQRSRTVTDRMRRLALRLSVPGFIEFDVPALCFYLLCIVTFCITSAADLNGSSTGAYSAIFGHGAPEHPLLGEPRGIRSDEWAYATPDILNQVLRHNQFEVENTKLGGHDVALVGGNMPVRHISTLFRPQYWSFFVLPLDYAYAVYWQCKALILILGVFTWLLLVTRSSFWAITGALWYFFSPGIQWAYSWPSALPEMIGLICLAMVFACYLTVGKSYRSLIVGAVLLSISAVDFALCAYVPHMIPLIWVAVFFMIAWCWGAKAEIFQRKFLGRRVLALSIAALIIASVGTKVYLDARVAINGIENTTYPGKRVFPSENTSVLVLTSNFFEWSEWDGHVPAPLGNICEGSGFLWLAPATLFLFRRLTLRRYQKFLLAALWCALLLVAAWLFLPVPAIVGKFLALDKTAGERCVPALGLANTAIVMLTMAAVTKLAAKDRNPMAWLGIFFRVPVIAVVVALLLHWTNQQLGNYFTMRAMILAVCITTILVELIFEFRRWALALALVIPQAVAFGSVNPIQRGLPVITSSPIYKFVQSNPRLLQGKWIVFSKLFWDSGFLICTGADVYTGIRYLPDIDHFALFTADGLNVKTFNNLGYLIAEPIDKNQKSSFEPGTSADQTQWNVNPSDPILKKLGIKYVAFGQKPSPSLTAGLVPLTTKPVDNYWLYRIQ